MARLEAIQPFANVIVNYVVQRKAMTMDTGLREFYW
jgi:hypothetical protein